MKKGLFFLMLLCCYFTLFAQEDAWVYLKDKQNVSTALKTPLNFLSQKAINRKNAHDVSIDVRDVAINTTYISQLKSATGITVMTKSKWLNAVHVRGNQVDITALTSLNFVKSIAFANKSLNINKTIKQKKESKFESTLTTFIYGSAENQVKMIHANDLHLANFTGAGMTVAVFDGGFPNVNTMGAFQRLRDAKHILGTRDFVDKDNDVYTNTTTSHGTHVLSTMAGYIENEYVGTAPDASYYLFITEDDTSENPVEESYWVEAAEVADSLGVDVINSSLGYKNYTNTNYNYSSADLDGKTTFITRGANIAFEKGMIVVNSAGNAGENGISAPADGEGVFSIGSVNSAGLHAASSSIGSAFQPSQKPDVVAQGEGSAIITEDNLLSTRSGTSFSSPIMAGGIVCLWQALPNKSNAEIMQLVRESASQYNTPDFYLGYGIPNLQTALNLALSVEANDLDTSIKIYPNPVKERVYFKFPSEEAKRYVTVFDMLGKQVLKVSVMSINNQIDISSFSKGMYLLKLNSKNTFKSFKILKQ